MKANREVLHDDSAAAVRHLNTRKAMANAWRGIASDVYSPRVCKGMPPFVERLAETFWKVDSSDVVSAITNGDPAFFVAFLIRLDQIDQALLDEGRGIAERTPVIRSRFIIDGFLTTAIKMLKRKGGRWPLVATDEPPE